MKERERESEKTNAREFAVATTSDSRDAFVRQAGRREARNFCLGLNIFAVLQFRTYSSMFMYIAYIRIHSLERSSRQSRLESAR